MYSISALVAAAVAAGCIACGSSGPSGNNGGDGDIEATAGLQFLPAQLTVTAGSSVAWEFGPVAHTVVFEAVAGRPTDITSATANQIIARTFSTAGTFPYVCTIHPGMTGTVIVTATGSSVPPPPPPAPPPPPPPPPGYP